MYFSFDNIFCPRRNILSKYYLMKGKILTSEKRKYMYKTVRRRKNPWDTHLCE